MPLGPTLTALAADPSLNQLLGYMGERTVRQWRPGLGCEQREVYRVVASACGEALRYQPQLILDRSGRGEQGQDIAQYLGGALITHGSR